MPNFNYVALDGRGNQTRGTLAVDGQLEAINRIKEMGFFPTRIVEVVSEGSEEVPPGRKRRLGPGVLAGLMRSGTEMNVLGKPVSPKALTVFTRQLATLLEAGMPLLRGLRLLQEQEQRGVLRQVVGGLAASIEGGSTLSESLAQYPKVFNSLYVNMVKAGEIGGVLEIVLKRLADFMEKAQKIKGKIVAASFYPAAVIIVAVTIMSLLMVFVVPKFKEVFDGLLNGQSLPTFTLFVFGISGFVKNHIVLAIVAGVTLVVGGQAFVRTEPGRFFFDKLKLSLPIFGPVVRKLAIARFTRTFGTLASSGVPILQALTIIKETSGNVLVKQAVSSIHEAIKEGDTIAAPMRASPVFPAMVVGMVDIGEQTGALPEMLMKIADTYEDEVDNAVSAMTSLLEPILIVFLAVVVGSIVVALFWPLTILITDIDPSGGHEE